MHNPFLDTVKDVAATLGRRLGTAASSFLIAQGVPQGSAEQAALAVAVILGICFDLILSKVHEDRSKVEPTTPSVNDNTREVA